MLITSAAIAVTISLWNRPLRWLFLGMSLIFVYTTLLNIGERPEGIKIASFFILAMIASSLTSRALRSTELRISGVDLDGEARELLQDDKDLVIRLIARKPKVENEQELDLIDREVRDYHSISPAECVIFLRSRTRRRLRISKTSPRHRRTRGQTSHPAREEPGGCQCVRRTADPSGKDNRQSAACLFQLERRQPSREPFGFLFFGEGDAAPLAHEVLRRAIEDPKHRPIIHVS